MREAQQRSISIQGVIFSWILASASPGLTFAQGSAVDVPENASVKQYTSGWECDRGYREANGACARVAVPANALLTSTSYGRGWECERGHRMVDEACVAIEVPEYAHLDSMGSRWKCGRGYRSVGETCLAIEVPPNAYLNASGDSWTCDRGYREVEQNCLAIAAWPSRSRRTDIWPIRRTAPDGDATAATKP
jgi:hypothetical protein